MTSTIENAYRQFCTERFPLPSLAQVEALEQRMGITFPSDYRRFLLEFNGGYFNEPEIVPVVEGCPLSALTDLKGIGASHPSAELAELSDLFIYDDNFPPQIVPIGSDPLGGWLLLDTAPGEGNGEIYFEAAFGDPYWLASGIEEFFSRLRPAADV